MNNQPFNFELWATLVHQKEQDEIKATKVAIALTKDIQKISWLYLTTDNKLLKQCLQEYLLIMVDVPAEEREQAVRNYIGVDYE